MLIKVLRAKLHRARVTEANVDYVGSITLDPDIYEHVGLLPGEAVLVADAGTVLSLTRVDGTGSFRGGRLLAGLGLQLEAMARGTALLPSLPAGDSSAAGLGEDDPAWPQATAAAMVVGVEAGLAAAVVAAARAAASRRLVLTGGDGARLHGRVAEALEPFGFTVRLRPLLCLESLAHLRPEG